MEKAKIYATGNENLSGNFNISYYIFEKDEKFLDWLEKLLKEVFEIENVRSVKFIVKQRNDEKGNWIEDEIFMKDIRKMIDLHEKYFNKEERVDVFYGKDRVYVTLKKSKEIREKFAKFVLKTKEWISISEIPYLPVYAGKKMN